MNPPAPRGATSRAKGAAVTTWSTLPGHVLPALTRAVPAPAGGLARDKTVDRMKLTIVLRRADEAGFAAWLAAVYDPASPEYRHFLTPRELADRFGPTADAYGAVRAYLQAQGLAVIQESDNRLTLGVEGSRADVENALAVHIRRYTLGKRAFDANDGEPSLPAGIAPWVQAVAGLSSLAVPRPGVDWLNKTFVSIVCDLYKDTWTYALTTKNVYSQPEIDAALATKMAACKTQKNPGDAVNYANAHVDPPPPAWQGVDGAGQTVGLVEFDRFDPSDVADFVHLTGSPFDLANLSRVAVNGGATPGADESEVLLDIDDVVSVAPGAKIKVFDAPFTGGSFQAVLNAMINGGVDIISNSWAYCEDQTTLADVQSIDAILQTAAAAGISVFSGTGDHGSTCLDGSPNTAAVPASAPHLTAVGGSSLSLGPGNTYAGETWWDGGATGGGQGGFAVSRFFARPAYQDGQNGNAMRSVPDVVANADPRMGTTICQASNGGCPTGLYYGGTSSSTPVWAAYAARLNQAQGTRLGFLNPALYPLASSPAFHSATRLGSDFAHVGLGSPDLARVHERLTSQTAGASSASVSHAFAYFAPGYMSVPEGVSANVVIRADGTSKGYVVVRLADGLGNVVSGKTVTLSASPSGHAVISPASGVSSADNGAVIFTITDDAVETITFTAIDTTDNVVLDDKPVIEFAVPPAANASIVAAPTTVAADGTSSATITVTLTDSLNRPTPGKAITLSQGASHSVITAPSPAVTDANGQMQFTATDTTGETVTYTALDATDGDLPVPGSASVTFTGGSVSCLSGGPVAAPGYALTSFATGFVAKNFFFGNINFTGCPGATNPAFDTSGNVYVADFPNGDLYRFAATGGAVSSANKVGNLAPTFGNIVFGTDGKLYATHFSPSDIVQVDPATGTVLRVLATGYTCPGGLAVDPLSGDLFFDDGCTGGGSDNPSIWRIHAPGSASPTVSVYASLPATPGGQIAFAPNGTLYVVAAAYNNASMPVVRITGTNTPSPGTVTTIVGLNADDGGIAIGELTPSGDAKSLLLHAGGALQLIDITATPFASTTLATGTIGAGVIGPDGCLYANAHDTILRLAPVSGGCGFTPTNPSPALALSPSTVSPDPAQGNVQSFTARFQNVAVPAGTPVHFIVKGANEQVKLAHTDATGAATISYVGSETGVDKVSATAVAGSKTLISNAVRLDWTAGRHVAFLTLNGSPESATPGDPVVLRATLVDTSSSSPAPISGVSVTFSVGAASCNGVTDASGTAQCSVVVPAGGTLTASFAGNGAFTPAAASQRLLVLGAAVLPPGAPVIGAPVAGSGQILVYFSPPASDGGSAITGYVAACAPTGGGPAVTAAGTASPIAVGGLVNGASYTCSVTAANSSGSGPASAPSVPVTLAAAPGVVQPVPALDTRMLLALIALLVIAGCAASHRAVRSRAGPRAG